MRRDRAHKLVRDRRRQVKRYQARVHGRCRRWRSAGRLQCGAIGRGCHEAAARRGWPLPPRAHAGEVQGVRHRDVECARQRALDSARGDSRSGQAVNGRVAHLRNMDVVRACVRVHASVCVGVGMCVCV